VFKTIEDTVTKHSKWFIGGLALLVVVMTFWKLGDHPVQPWDEARQGVLGLEMNERGDYVNYYYGNKVDNWNAKPPLMIWSISLSYHLFGYNAWAMRVPSAIGTLIFFLFSFLLVRKYRGNTFAIGTVLILLSCHAILGRHIGRTADYEALLLPTLTGFVYFFCLYLDFQKKNAIFYAGICLGLAFYAKGTPSVFLLPGALLYVVARGRFMAVIKDWRVWTSLGIYAGFIVSWFLILGAFGLEFSDNQYGDSATETMLVYDTFERYFNPARATSDPWFFAAVIDIKLNVWNYLFYLAVLLGVVQLVKHRENWREFVAKEEHRLLLLSVCMVATLGSIISLSAEKWGWYLAPIFLFIAIITFGGIQFSVKWKKPLIWLFAVVFAFALGRHFTYLHQPEEKIDQFIETQAKALKSADHVYVYRLEKEPNIFLNLKWHNYKTFEIGELDQIKGSTENTVIIYRASELPDYKATAKFGDIHFLYR
jgi:4-amino-4-deoxy-L-arabinose transferase-like glycosyltransferase